jgi:hypothetical protein
MFFEKHNPFSKRFMNDHIKKINGTAFLSFTQSLCMKSTLHEQ